MRRDTSDGSTMPRLRSGSLRAAFCVMLAIALALLVAMPSGLPTAFATDDGTSDDLEATTSSVTDDAGTDELVTDDAEADSPDQATDEVAGEVIDASVPTLESSDDALTIDEDELATVEPQAAEDDDALSTMADDSFLTLYTTPAANVIAGSYVTYTISWDISGSSQYTTVDGLEIVCQLDPGVVFHDAFNDPHNGGYRITGVTPANPTANPSNAAHMTYDAANNTVTVSYDSSYYEFPRASIGINVIASPDVIAQSVNSYSYDDGPTARFSATASIGGNAIDTVTNETTAYPYKAEGDVPGAGNSVEVGETIPYRIYWATQFQSKPGEPTHPVYRVKEPVATLASATEEYEVVITDTLDEGLDFVSATPGNIDVSITPNIPYLTSADPTITEDDVTVAVGTPQVTGMLTTDDMEGSVYTATGTISFTALASVRTSDETIYYIGDAGQPKTYTFDYTMTYDPSTRELVWEIYLDDYGQFGTLFINEFDTDITGYVEMETTVNSDAEDEKVSGLVDYDGEVYGEVQNSATVSWYGLTDLDTNTITNPLLPNPEPEFGALLLTKQITNADESDDAGDGDTDDSTSGDPESDDGSDATDDDASGSDGTTGDGSSDATDDDADSMQGDFGFGLTVTPAPEGLTLTAYKVRAASTDAAPGVAWEPIDETDVLTLEFDADGVCQTPIRLNADEGLYVYGIPDGSTVTVKETTMPDGYAFDVLKTVDEEELDGIEGEGVASAKMVLEAHYWNKLVEADEPVPPTPGVTTPDDNPTNPASKSTNPTSKLASTGDSLPMLITIVLSVVALLGVLASRRSHGSRS